MSASRARFGGRRGDLACRRRLGASGKVLGVAVGCGPKPPPAPGPDAVSPHQVGDPVSSHPAALSLQRGMHAGAAIAVPAVGMDAADGVDQRPVARGQAGAFWPTSPRVVAAGADLQHRAHHPHDKHRPVVFDELEPHLGGPEKMLMAFFKMSRSIRVRSSSFCRRRIGQRRFGAPVRQL